MAKLKNLKEGNYVKISAVYIPLIDGQGCTCDNCGRLIANIVTVKNIDENKQYTIGQDCAKNLFSQDENKAIDKEIKQGIRDAKYKEDLLRREKWQTALNELNTLWKEDGGSSENINEQWSRDVYNKHLAAMEIKHEFHISYKR